MKQYILIASLLQSAFATKALLKNYKSEDLFLQLREEPVEKAELPPSEDKVPQHEVETEDDKVNKQIKE